MTAGRPLRVTFAGDAARFAAWAPGGIAAASGAAPPARAPSRLLPTFADTRDAEAGAVADLLRASRPDVVVALGVAEHDPEVLRAAGAPVLGVVVPAARPPLWAVRSAKPGAHPDRATLDAAETDERGRIWAPGSPGAACDRLVALDPIDALGAPLWRTIAPPVDDALFAGVTASRRPPRFLFAGHSTDHREAWLATAKHLHDVRHLAHGITPDRLPTLLEQTDVALVAHPTERRTFDHRVALHLAAGHLVIAEPLQPRHGLEPNLDHLVVGDPDALARLVGAIRDAPDVFHRTRVRGRLKAEQFRASHVWGRVLDDLLRDLRA